MPLPVSHSDAVIVLELMTIPELVHGGATMVYIPRQDLKSMEHLFEQSSHGLHLLFDHSEVAKILKTPTEDLDFFNFENVNRIQDAFGELLTRKTFAERKVYLENLDRDTYELLVRTYFNIVENAMFEASGDRH